MNNLPKKDLVLFRTLAIMLFSFIWIGFLLTLMSVFYTSAVWLIWIGICGFLFYKKILVFPKPSREMFLYILIAGIFSLSIAFFTEPTIFAGRDQGSIAETSLRLEKNHTLIFQNNVTQAFFEIYKTDKAKFYGYGEALNFPGFHYLVDGSLITQFPIPYISFLASFIGFFGLNGFIVANGILTFFFVLATGFLVRYLLNRKYTLIFLALLLSSFPISFFAKFTLSENLAGAVLWISIVLYLQTKDFLNKENYFAFFLAISILPFTRIEGFWFFAILTFLFLKNKENRQFVFQDFWHRAILPLIILFCIFLASFIINTPFYYTMTKAFLKNGESSKTPFIEKINYLLEVYSLYNSFIPLILTSLLSFKAVLKKEFRFLILPVGIILPLFIYYLSPQITLDHPWMLRRFSFALIPVTLMASVFFIATLKKEWKTTKYILILLLLIFNLISFIPFFTYRENVGLKEQVHEFAKQFGENDLILLDKNVAGNGWTMLTTPLNLLENKQAVYFFNPNDLEKLNLEKFEKVFLVVPNEKEEFYSSILKSQFSYYNEYSFTTNQLKIEESKKLPVFLPKKESLKIKEKVWELKK